MLNITVLGACAAAAGAVLLPRPSNAADDFGARCVALAGVSLPPAVIGQLTKGATIASTAMTDASDPNGEFCKIVGAIHPVDKNAPEINFQLNVPSHWNGKALQLGGGGYDGTVVTGLAANFLGRDAVQPLKRGYATFGSDSGHKGAGADASFGANDEALANFGGNQLNKVHDVAVELLRRVAGSVPRRMYFEGNSQGGHEGFNVVQRWPRDYDGVVSIHPVYNITALQLDGVHVGQALYGSPGAWISPAKTKLIYDSVMKACDSLDGAADGVIANVKDCRTAFKLDALRCAAGKDTGDACLSDAQIRTVRTIGSRYEIGFALEDGVSSFAPWPIVEGGSALQIFNFGAKPNASNPPAPPAFGPPGGAPPDAFAYVMGDAMVRHMALRDPNVDTLKFDPAQHQQRLKVVSKILDASSVEIEPFRDRGGKLLLLHGTADMAVPPQNTIDYYERLVSRFGADKLKDFVRFYVVPGFGHGDGPFQASWDWLSALDNWVENGKAPANLVAVDTAMPTAGRSRPLCEYPAWPKYKGSGDVNAAGSFVCATD
jgi:pimeloyl-ACP methyl ester carboxylesterase